MVNMFGQRVLCFLLLFRDLVHSDLEFRPNDQKVLFLSSKSSNDSGSIDITTEKSTTKPQDYTYNSSEEGLHLVVVHPISGRSLLERSFKTTSPYSSWADLIFFLRETETGYVVSLTITGRGSYGLRDVKTFLSDYGSFFAPYLDFLEKWTWVFVKGGKTVYETIARSQDNDTKGFQGYFASQLIHTTLRGSAVLIPRPAPTTLGSGIDGDSNHSPTQNFCSLTAAVKLICETRIDQINQLRWTRQVRGPDPISELAIIVTAGNRTSYLLYTLYNLLSAEGAPRENILVILGSKYLKTIELLNILQIPFLLAYNNDIEGNKNLFYYYRNVFRTATEYFSAAKYFSFIDEDVLISPDYFNYLNQTIPMLNEDPSLYCINAHSMVTDIKQIRGEGYLRRGETQIFWGSAMTRKFVLRALEAWSQFKSVTENNYLYDYWIYRTVRGDKECIYPDISRVRHFGLGINTQLSNHEYEGWRPFLRRGGVTLINRESLLNDEFELTLKENLTSAIKISTLKPWLYDYKKGKNYIIFFSMEDNTDVYSWYVLAGCFGLHMTNEQGHHKGLFTAYLLQNRTTSFKENDTTRKTTKNYEREMYSELPNKESLSTVFLIGIPFSKYTYLYQKGDHILDYQEMKDHEVTKLINSCVKEVNLMRNKNHTNQNLIISVFTDA